MNIGFIDKLRQFIWEIPKAELHLHMEGAISVETLLHLIRREGNEPSIKKIDDLRQRLCYKDFQHFIDVWVWKNTFIREEENSEEIAYQVLRNLSEQNVKYVDAFYSPGDYRHRRKGLSAQGIIECLITGKERAYRVFGIRRELIVDLIRDHGPAIGRQRLDELTPYLGKGLIGIGVGESEQEFLADPHAALYHEAKERGFRPTAHAGGVIGPSSI